jgi:hypothetical protein
MNKSRGVIGSLPLRRIMSVRISASLGTLKASDQSASLGRNHTGRRGISPRRIPPSAPTSSISLQKEMSVSIGARESLISHIRPIRNIGE